jgi:hypothetical protein
MRGRPVRPSQGSPPTAAPTARPQSSSEPIAETLEREPTLGRQPGGAGGGGIQVGACSGAAQMAADPSPRQASPHRAGHSPCFCGRRAPVIS